MRWSEIPFSPPTKVLRQFAGLWIVFFGSLAIWQGVLRDNTVFALVFGALAIIVGTVGLLYPQAIRPLFVGWMLLAYPIGWLISHLLLATLFYLVFTPIGLFFRMIGRDALNRMPQPEVGTYWKIKASAPDMKSYFRQS